MTGAGWIVVLGLVLAPQVHCESSGKKIFKWSVAALLAANAADAASSWGQPEANRLLAGPRGRFDSRGLSIKLGVVGAIVVGEIVLVRHHPQAATRLGFVNFSTAGLTGSIAVHNLGVK